jgi:hypothetical protein
MIMVPTTIPSLLASSYGMSLRLKQNDLQRKTLVEILDEVLALTNEAFDEDCDDSIL